MMLAAASGSAAAASISFRTALNFKIVSISEASVDVGVGRTRRTLHFGDYVALELCQPPIIYERKNVLEKAIGPAASSSVPSPSIQAVSKEWLAAQFPGERPHTTW